MSRYRRSRCHGGTFFFTLALADRASRVLVDEVQALRSAYGRVHQARPFKTIAICILPDHLHALWQLPEGDTEFSLRWSLIKSGFSRRLPAAPRSDSKTMRREKGIWQRRFWEHQIRDEQDLERHLDYIHFNPVRHGLVARVRDWPYSSFRRYVAAGQLPLDWGGSQDEDIPVGEP